MDNKNGISEYSKDAMFPAMGSFAGYLFYQTIDYVGNPIVTAVIVYLTIFTIWTIIRTSSSFLAPRIKQLGLSLIKKAMK